MPKKKKKEIIFGRPVDESLEAYKEFITGLTKALTGKSDDDSMTPEEWEADWKEFWKGAQHTETEE